jgi:hypothetical protein
MRTKLPDKLNCVQRATAHVFNQTLEEMTDVFAYLGRKHRCKTKHELSYPVIELFGGKPQKRGIGYSIGKFCKRNPKGTFLVFTHNHLTVIENGAMYDDFSSRYSYVTAVYKIPEKQKVP